MVSKSKRYLLFLIVYKKYSGCGNAMCREQGNTNNKAVCDKCNFEFCFECCEEVNFYSIIQ